MIQALDCSSAFTEVKMSRFSIFCPQLTAFVFIFYAISCCHCKKENITYECAVGEPGSSHCNVLVPKGLIPESYYNFKRPDPLDGDNTTSITVTLRIYGLPDFNENDGELGIEWEFWMNWYDDRFTKFYEKYNAEEKMQLNTKLLNRIWHPPIYIDQLTANTRTALIDTPGELKIYAMYQEDGMSLWQPPRILYGARSTIKTACDFDYTYYPLDVVTCPINIRSSLYTNDQLEIEFANGHIEGDLDVTGFQVLVTYQEGQVFKNVWDQEYSGLTFNITLKREISFNLIQNYIPSLILVFICFGSFTMDDGIERIGCATVSLLSLLVMLNAIGQSMPQVTNLTGIHIWMIMCIIVVFLPVTEIFFVFKLKQIHKWKVLRSRARKNKVGGGTRKKSLDDRSKEEDKEDEEIPLSGAIKTIVSVIENITPILVISGFVLFNALYWPWLIGGHPVDQSSFAYPTHRDFARRHGA